MFENVGSKVKSLAKVICWLGIIGSIIGGIVIWVSGGNSSSYYSYSYRSSSNGFTFWYGLLTIVLGSFFSWLGSLTTYAIGEAAEYAEINNVKLNEIEEKLKENRSAETKSEQQTSHPVTTTYSVPVVGDTWRCPNCGSYNKKTDQYCKDCGTYR